MENVLWNGGVCVGELAKAAAAAAAAAGLQDWGTSVNIDVCQSNTTKQPKIGAMLLAPLANLDVPFGQVLAPWELCRVNWCGEYCSAVKV
jgi:hypothetical protein